jgi:hypothetical protein
MPCLPRGGPSTANTVPAATGPTSKASRTGRGGFPPAACPRRRTMPADTRGDRTLFEITKKGTAAVAGGGYESDMPGFDGVLSDDQIREVLAFIKSTWPERERRFQESVSQSDREAQR